MSASPPGATVMISAITSRGALEEAIKEAIATATESDAPQWF